MSVRAKFVCNSKEEVAYQSRYGTRGWRIKFGAVWQGTGADGRNAAVENHIFGDATPSGSMEIFIANPEAANQFSAGEMYYLDFTHAGPIVYFDKGEEVKR